MSFFHEFWEFLSLHSDTFPSDIVSTNKRYSSYFYYLINEKMDMMIGNVFFRPINASDIFMISYNSIDTVGRSEFFQIFPNISSHYWSKFSIYDVSRK